VEIEPKSDNVQTMDLVWKPVNFVRSAGFDSMARRVAQ
jgi:hypothetical protein